MTCTHGQHPATQWSCLKCFTSQQVRDEAWRRLDGNAVALRQRLADGDTNAVRWEERERMFAHKHGKGELQVFKFDYRKPGPNVYPGVHYTSSMGANSDNSYSGFLPGVTVEEALLLVYKPWKKSIS